MHFSVPDTTDFSNRQTGATYTGFNIHINGTFHCCMRYKQLHSLNEQLRRSLPTLTLPAFPSKKLLPLTPHQVELRRHAIERYIQLLGQDPVFSKSELLRCFLLSAQQESTFTEARETTVDVFLMNGFRIDVNCYTVECSSKVLAKACHNIDVRPEYASYLALYLMRKERDGGVTLVRRLMDFEAPYISQRLQDECKIVIRKSYWDPCHDAHLMLDSIALNVLYIQTLHDVDRGWILTTSEQRTQLHQLQHAGNKREYLEVARTLPAYGCLKFANASVCYPAAPQRPAAGHALGGGDINSSPILADVQPTAVRQPPQPAAIYIGNKELCVRMPTSTVGGAQQQTATGAEQRFKVTLMRCWRVTTNYSAAAVASADSAAVLTPASTPTPPHTTMELSFEYLVAKKQLQWVTVCSEQAMLMSVCLQSMVEELLSRKDDAGVGVLSTTTGSDARPMSFVRRDGLRQAITETAAAGSAESANTGSSGDVSIRLNVVAAAGGCEQPPPRQRKQRREKICTTVLFRTGKGSVHNEAFEGGIGDEDL